MYNLSMKYFRKSIFAVTIAALVGLALPKDSFAGSLENLERERALVLETILNPALTPTKRLNKLENSRARLVDLERMVLRDKKLNDRNTPTVSRAFENYDLTFLLHASIERNLTITDNWLSQMGLTTQSIMSASVGRQSGQ